MQTYQCFAKIIANILMYCNNYCKVSKYCNNYCTGAEYYNTYSTRATVLQYYWNHSCPQRLHIIIVQILVSYIIYTLIYSTDLPVQYFYYYLILFSFFFSFNPSPRCEISIPTPFFIPLKY